MESHSHEIHLKLPAGHWQALQAHTKRTGESYSGVLRKALANFLDLEHHTLWQLSTATAVAEGLYDSCLRVRDLADYGDFGLGTFDQLDGEGIQLDGECWQAKSDGSVSRAPDLEGTPFWIATHFQTEKSFLVDAVDTFEDLGKQIDAYRPSANLFISIRIKGLFDQLLIRAVSSVEKGVDLVEAAGEQSLFNLKHVKGTLVGFWSPDYSKSLSIPGYHFHFLSDNRKHGGHLLDLKTKEVLVELDLESNLRLALPETKEFLEADLNNDPTQKLKKAENKPTSNDLD